ncbi:MAG: LysM peptidoglycan-binding domain-containing protein [Caldilinea sp. CFX5]|nr:LysM peptidoglycan-binding domain-containing protein [Caldilinea sp. CFX5]
MKAPFPGLPHRRGTNYRAPTMRQSGLLVFVICFLCFARGSARATPLTQAPIVSPAAVSTPTSLPNGNHGEMASDHYVVKAGDTLWRVALEMGIDVALMPCTVAPTFSPEQPLVIGNTLERLPPDQWCHTVQSGETLATIAAIYGVSAEQIYKVAWNQLTTPVAAVQLTPGSHLRIPLQPAPTSPTGSQPGSATGAPSFLNWMLNQPVNTSPFTVLAVGGPFAEQKQLLQRLSERALRPIDKPGAVPANWPYGSGVFRWPLSGWLTQGYRYDHRAIDIAAPTGTPVLAADRGVVVRAGWNQQGYGLFVIIDHNIDYLTLYAHLSEVLVEEGQVVAQGDLLGKVGSTGNSTGPHLHFEIRDFGRLTNPLELLSR